LKLGLVRYSDNNTKDDWIDYNDLVIIYRRFIEMISLNSCDNILSLTETDERIFIAELKLRYSQSKIDALIKEKLSTRKDKVSLSEFVRLDLGWLASEDCARQTLLINEEKERKTVTHTVVTRTVEPTVTSTKQVVTYESSGYEKPEVVKKSVVKRVVSEAPKVEPQVETNTTTTTTSSTGYGGYGMGGGALRQIYERHATNDEQDGK